MIEVKRIDAFTWHVEDTEFNPVSTITARIRKDGKKVYDVEFKGELIDCGITHFQTAKKIAYNELNNWIGRLIFSKAEAALKQCFNGYAVRTTSYLHVL